MSVIPGVTVNWRTSPRIITIPSTETEVTIVDLQDTLLDLEDDDEGILWPHLRETSGGEDLGGGTSVGWTMELQNAYIAFEPRTTSDSNGTITTPNSAGTTLIDTGADFISDGIQAGDTILNSTDGSVSTVISVDDANTITCYALTDGSDNQFDSSDAYKIWNKIQCEVTGGNLVAVDDVGSSINPIMPTAFTHAVRTSSSSATALSQSLLEFAAYNGQIEVDPGSSYTYSDYPDLQVGTGKYPVNNIPDAVTLAGVKGFKKLKIRDDLTVDSGSDIQHFLLEGVSHAGTQIIIDTSAQTLGMTITKADVAGVLDGATKLADCMIGDLVYFHGHIHQCGLYGTIYLGGGQDAVIADCITVDTTSFPIIDCGGSGQNLAMPNYSGIVTIKNVTDAGVFVGVGLLAGTVYLDPSTVTNGTIHVSGGGTLRNSSTQALIPSGTWNTNVTIINTLTSNESIAGAVWDEDITTHTGTDSAGETVQDIEKKIEDTQAIALL